VYIDSKDLRSKRFASLEEFETSWTNDLEEDLETLREAKCHEVVMMWAHHLPEMAKICGREGSCPHSRHMMQRRPTIKYTHRPHLARQAMQWSKAGAIARTSGQIGQRSSTTRRRPTALTHSGGVEVLTQARLIWKFGGARNKALKNFLIQRALASLLGSMDLACTS